MINRFILNEVSYFGPGAREVLPKEIARLGLHKAFVVTDKDLIKYGVADKVLSVLKSAGIPYEIFSEIKQNPTVFNVKTGVKAFAESGADFILAIGGGSSIDSAKAVGIITNNPEFSDVVSLEGVADTKKKSGGSGQAFRQGVHQLCIHNSYSRNIIWIDAYHFLFVCLIRNHIVDCYFGGSSGSGRQGNDRNGFLFRICHTFQRNDIAEFRIVGNNSDSFCTVY